MAATDCPFGELKKKIGKFFKSRPIFGLSWPQKQCGWSCIRQSRARAPYSSGWSAKIPVPDGRSNLWHESAVAAAQVAMITWVRVGANMSARAYDVTRAVETIPEPMWHLKTSWSW